MVHTNESTFEKKITRITHNQETCREENGDDEEERWQRMDQRNEKNKKKYTDKAADLIPAHFSFLIIFMQTQSNLKMAHTDRRNETNEMYKK